MDAAAIILGEVEEKCRECGSTDLVENPAAGTVYCQSCGLEHRSYMIDYRTEWRTFSDKDKAENDAVRVGGPLNLLLTNAGLMTSLSKADTSFDRMARTADPDRKLKRGFREIEALCDKLNLTTQKFKDRANEVFKKASEAHLQRSFRLEVIYASTVLYVTKLESGNFSRTFKEIILASGVPQKELSKCLKRISDELKNDQGLRLVEGGGTDVVSVAANFAGYLDLPKEVRAMVQKVALMAKPGSEEGEFIEQRDWDSRSPDTIAATVIFIVTQLPKCPRKLSAKDIMVNTGVREATIAQCYRDMYPVAEQLIPASVATPEEIRAALKAPKG